MKLVVITESYKEQQWMMGLVGELIQSDVPVSPKIRVPDKDGVDHFIYGYECWWGVLPDLPDIPRDIKPGESIPAYVFKEMYRDTGDSKRLMDEIAIQGGHLSAADALSKIRTKIQWKDRIMGVLSEFVDKAIGKIEYSDAKDLKAKMKVKLAPYASELKKYSKYVAPGYLPSEEEYLDIKEYFEKITFD